MRGKLTLLLICTLALQIVFAGNVQKLFTLTQKQKGAKYNNLQTTSDGARVKKSNHSASLVIRNISTGINDSGPFIALSANATGNHLSNENIRIYYRLKGQKTWQLLEHSHEAQEPNRYFSNMAYLPINTTVIDLMVEWVETKNPPVLSSLKLNFFNPGHIQIQGSLIDEPAPKSDRGGCNCNQPTSVPRSSWGSGLGLTTSIYTPPASYTTVTHLVIHHAAGTNNSSNWAAEVAAVFNLHVNTNGWQDIGYNWVIDPNGVLYVGRGGGDNVVGAHFCGTNNGTMGVCLLGNYMTATPTSAALAKLEQLLAWKACQTGIDPLGTANHSGSGLNLNTICGHQNGICSTSCPGTNLYSQLSSIRNNVNTLLNSPTCSLSSVSAPANDACANAESIPTLQLGQCVSATAGEDMANATQSLAPSTNCGGTASANAYDVWFKFTPICTTQTITVVPSSSMDAAVSLHTTCTSSAIACADNAGGANATENLTYNNFTIGTTYYVRVYDYNNQAGAGTYPSTTTFDICINTPPANCTPSQPDLQISSASVSASSVQAGSNITLDYTVINNTNGVVDSNSRVGWYLIPQSGACPVSVPSTGFDSFNTLTASEISDGTEVEPNNPVSIPAGTSPGTYYLVIFTDDQNNITESDESNNSYCITITVSSPPCVYDIPGVSESLPSSSVQGDFVVNATSGCSWIATESCQWVTLTSSSGTGNGSVSYTLAPNTDTTSRTCVITVEGETFTITQEGITPCFYNLNPSSNTYPSTAGSGSFSVTAGTGCSWTATESCSWVTLTNSSGTGNGSLNYSFTANTDTATRTCTITVNGENYIVTQQGATPSATLTADFYASQTSGCVPLSVDFFDNSAGNPQTYVWEFLGQGISPATSTSQNPAGITYSQSGVYTVKLTVLGNNSSDMEVKTGYITVNDCGVGVNDITDNTIFSIYPNPSAGNFTLQIDASGKNQLAWIVYDMQGRLIAKKAPFTHYGNYVERIQLPETAKGIYLIQVWQNEAFYTQTVSVE